MNEGDKFEFRVEGGDEHIFGDEECEGCWKSPVRCDCGGLIHNQFGDEDSNCNYWLYEFCENCDEEKLLLGE